MKYRYKRKLVALRMWLLFPLEYGFALPRHWKQAVLLATDFCLMPLAFWGAVAFRYGRSGYEFQASDFITMMITMVFSAAFFLRKGLYRAIVRFMGQHAILTIVYCVAMSSLILSIAGFVTRSNIPRSTPLIYFVLAFVMIGGLRLTVRAVYQGIIARIGDRVAIYGAGVAGRQLMTALMHGDYRPVVFLDDNHRLVGTVINGIPVHHSSELPHLIDKKALSHVFLAMPSAPRKRRVEIISDLESLPVHIKKVPDFVDLMSGKAKVGQLHDIELEDLLGRDAVPANPELIGRCITGQVVMVTGAGGSIGAELCQQIIKHHPKELVLFDSSEYSLYAINEKLCKEQATIGQTVEVTPLLGNVMNEAHITSIYRSFKVDTVYHAAAYKHVPVVEKNVAEGVRNNVFGTLSAAGAAIECEVKNFVLVSTDKAVRPSNIMGASKRMAELILQDFATSGCDTVFSMVRFGNVLGSSGSVVPLFREQIESGGPVTVTHEDITRYFMTIPEAAQLVLQASAMAKGGDVFVLDMGEPVKIVALARRLIRLMGYEIKDAEQPYGDIEIRYSGLRPGEKLFEELLIGENVTGTEHPKIMRAQEESCESTLLKEYLEVLSEACNKNDCDTINSVLSDAVCGFNLRDGIIDEQWTRKIQEGTLTSKKVVKGAFVQNLRVE